MAMICHLRFCHYLGPWKSGFEEDQENEDRRRSGMVGYWLTRRQKQLLLQNWDDMSIMENAMDLYMEKKGLLFWLNKFAYASIFVVIGGWIFLGFVGPALNLYQLDSAPLSPSSMFKGS